MITGPGERRTRRISVPKFVQGRKWGCVGALASLLGCFVGSLVRSMADWLEVLIQDGRECRAPGKGVLRDIGSSLRECVKSAENTRHARTRRRSARTSQLGRALLNDLFFLLFILG